MDIFAIQKILQEVSYKPGYRFGNWEQYGRNWIQLQVDRKDAVTGKVETGKTLPVILDEKWTRDQVLRQAFKLIVGYEEHEVRESFKFKGKAIFGPHVEIDQLLDATPDSITHPEGKSGAW